MCPELKCSRRNILLVVCMMKFSRAISRVKWLSGEQTNASKTISVFVGRTEMVFETLVCSKYPEDEDRDGLRDVGLLTAQPFDPADSPRELHHTQSPGKQQISLVVCSYKIS
jgi:hypothetical protein